MKLKTIFKKVTAAALAATMVVGMAACGSGSETASSSDSAGVFIRYGGSGNTGSDRQLQD